MPAIIPRHRVHHPNPENSMATIATDVGDTTPDVHSHDGHSYFEDKQKILARLSRIEGQVRGVSKMVEDDKYCIDILTQLSAIISSSRNVGLLVLEDHIKGCVVNGAPEEREARVAELNQAIERFVRSVG
jgi:DNA-binding FrmR family transcriptional regulator